MKIIIKFWSNGNLQMLWLSACLQISTWIMRIQFIEALRHLEHFSTDFNSFTHGSELINMNSNFFCTNHEFYLSWKNYTHKFIIWMAINWYDVRWHWWLCCEFTSKGEFFWIIFENVKYHLDICYIYYFTLYL